MDKSELEFAKKWDSLSDKEKWKMLFKDYKNFELSVFIDYDCLNVINETGTMFLDFDENVGCLSAVEILLEDKGISIDYAK